MDDVYHPYLGGNIVMKEQKKCSFGEWVMFGVFAPVRPKSLRTALVVGALVLETYWMYRAVKELSKIKM